MPAAFGSTSLELLTKAASSEPGTTGVDLVSGVTTSKAYEVEGGDFRVVAYDLGIKKSIVEQLSEIATVFVVPAQTTSDQVLALEPHGVFLSNGPGDPMMAGQVVTALGALLGKVPVFGICLGHQILSLAMGGKTSKLKFGHRGANQPVKDLDSGRVEITSQNHGFTVDADSLPDDVAVNRINLNDQTVEGLRHKTKPVFCVQYHPEAAPGPHDSRYLFDDFKKLMEG